MLLSSPLSLSFSWAVKSITQSTYLPTDSVDLSTYPLCMYVHSYLISIIYVSIYNLYISIISLSLSLSHLFIFYLPVYRLRDQLLTKPTWR